MNHQYDLGLAASGLKTPIGTHLVPHRHPDHVSIPDDGRRLGGVIEEAARRFRCPMALPLMDLKQEKEALLLARGIAPFSLMSKLISDPITPVHLAGDGATAEDEEEVAMVDEFMKS